MGQNREDSQGQEQRREWGQRIADVDKGLSRLTLADLFPMRTDALSLQAKMCCERDATGRKNGSWVFSIGGQKSVLLESHDKEWKKLHPGARRLKTWESDRDTVEFFCKVSMGDCQSWLENFLLNRKEMLETTGKSKSFGNNCVYKCVYVCTRV